MKHMIRKNNEQVRKSQQRAMAYLYQTFEECAAIWESRKGVEMMPELEEAGTVDYYDADFASVWDDR